MINARCTNIRPVLDKGNLRAFADVELIHSDVTLLLLRAVRVVQQAGQKAWVSMAAQKGRDGRWHLVVQLLDDELKAKIKATVLAAYEELA